MYIYYSKELMDDMAAISGQDYSQFIGWNKANETLFMMQYTVVYDKNIMYSTSGPA